ncbi:MAG: metallophosphoesterase [Bacteroidia bacterium]
MKKLIITIAIAACLNTNAQFTFVHISDLHVASVPSLVNSCDLNGVMAQCYLQKFNTLIPKPNFVIATGDISNVGNSFPVMYSVLTQYLFPPTLTNPGIGAYHIDTAQTIPMYFAAGNHDYYTTLYPPGSMTQTNYLTQYAQNIAPDTDYAVTTGISVILFMRSGNDIPYWNEIDPFTPDGSGLTTAQLAWIRNELSLNSGKRKIIVMHHPPVNLAGTNCDGTPYTSQTILDTAAGTLANNRTTFLNICDSNHVDVVLAGHQHQNVVTDRVGTTIAENCTTCGTRYVQTGAAFNGCYRTISVSSASVTVSLPMLSCNPTAGINELNNMSSISVYPNPASTSLTLTLSKGEGTSTLQITDMLGSTVKQLIIHNSSFIIDVSDLAEGVYQFIIHNSEFTINKKVVIVR